MTHPLAAGAASLQVASQQCLSCKRDSYVHTVLSVLNSLCCAELLLLLQELRDVNMATMQHQPPSAEHWRNAWQAANLSEAQRRQICAVKDFTCSRLEALDAERKQLLEEQATLDAAAAAAAAVTEHQEEPAGDSVAASSSDRASNRSADSSSSNSGLIERRRWEVAQQLARVNSAWRMLTQLRSQFVVMVLQPVQAARIVCAVYPYMLLGGPLYQHFPGEDGCGADEAVAACSGCYGGVADGVSSGNNAADINAEADTTSSGDAAHQESKRWKLAPAALPETAAVLVQKPGPDVLMQQVVQLQAPPMRVHPAWCNLPQVLVRPQLPQLVQLVLAQGRVSSGCHVLQQLLPLHGALQGPLLLCCSAQEEDIAVVGDNF
jgi:hypothetical protein